MSTPVKLVMETETDTPRDSSKKKKLVMSMVVIGENEIIEKRVDSMVLSQ